MKMRATLLSFAAVLLLACTEKPSEPTPPPPAPEPAKPTEPAHEHPAAEPGAAPGALPAVPAGAKVSFVAPADGAKIEGPLENGKVAVPIKMGAEGIAVKPAGEVEAGSGHHHVLIDVEPEPMGTVVGKDDQHLHFGKAQTEATLQLTPGEHTLRLQFADGIHRSYGPELTAMIKVNVVAAGTVAAPAAAEKTAK